MGELLFAIVIFGLATLTAWLAVRALRLPPMIAVVAGAMLVGGVVFAVVANGVELTAVRQVAAFDAGAPIVEALLALLLFTAALHVDLARLRRGLVMLGIGSAILSTVLVGLATYGLLVLLTFEIELIEALMFGALISPSDPIGVLRLTRSAHGPVRLQEQLVGEALWNAATVVVLFSVMNAARTDTVPHIAQAVLGAAGLGAVVGCVASPIARRAQTVVTVGAALVTIAVAWLLTLSAPIAAFVASLVIGTFGRKGTSLGRDVHVGDLWRRADEYVTAILFMLIVVFVMVGPLSIGIVLAAYAVIAIVILARWSAVAVALKVIPLHLIPRPPAARYFTWSALRGGVSIALALLLPSTSNVLVTITFIAVASSFVIAGLLFRPPTTSTSAARPS